MTLSQGELASVIREWAKQDPDVAPLDTDRLSLALACRILEYVESFTFKKLMEPTGYPELNPPADTSPKQLKGCCWSGGPPSGVYEPDYFVRREQVTAFAVLTPQPGFQDTHDKLIELHLRNGSVITVEHRNDTLDWLET